MAPNNPSKKEVSAWFRRFVAAGAFEKIGMLGNAAFNLASNLVDEGVERTSHLLEGARDAFLEGYDPEVDDAQIVEEEIIQRNSRNSQQKPPQDTSEPD